MKKIISIFLAVAMLVSSAAFSVYAEEEKPAAVIVMADNSKNIIEYDRGYFFIEFDRELDSGIYKTECILDGEVFKSFDISYKKGTKLKKYVSLPVLSKGMHTLAVRINGEAIEESELTFAAVEIYKKQQGDEFSRIGINTHIKSADDIITLSRGGAINMRQSFYWNGIEREKKVYSIADYQYIKNAFEKTGTVCLFETAFGNTLYVNDIPNTKWNTPPRTREQIDAFADYVVETLKSFPEIRKVEIWNEPNLATKGRAANMSSIEYIQMMKRVALAVKEYDPTIILMCGALANQKSIEFTEHMLELGAQDLFDGVSIHPYCYPNNPDERFIEKAAPNWVPVYEYGGWMEMYATEMGFPNHINTAGITEEKSAVYFPKMYVLGDYAGYGELYWHNGVNNGWDAYNREDNFGILRADYTPKPAFCAMSQACKVLNNARYIGMYHPTEGINAYCYVKEGKPVMVCWSPKGEAEYDFGAFARVEDLFGNQLPSKLTVGEEPVYVSGIGGNVLFEGAAFMAEEGYSKFIEKWKDKADISEIYKLFENIGSIKSDSVLNTVKNHYKAADSLITQYKDKKLELTDMTCMLYELHEIGERLCNLYALENTRSPMSSKDVLGRIQKKIKEIKNGNKYASIRFTERIVKNALSAVDRGEKILKDSKNASVYGYAAADNLMANMLLLWAEQLVLAEECNHYAGLLTYMYPARLDTFLGRKSMVTLSVDNKTNRDINAEVLWFDDKGNQAGEAMPITLASGKAKEYELPVDIDMKKELGSHIYEARIVSEGKVIGKQWLDVTVSSAASVRLEPSLQTFSDMNKIEVSVTNNYDDDINGTLTVTSPEGWELSEGSRKITVPNGETKLFTFNITAKTQAPYNEYAFRVELKDNNGFVLANESMPLDFLIITDSAGDMDVKSFDGDMSAWVNAYPIHIGTPEAAHERESWYGVNRGARAYAMYTENNYYMLIDVYDDYSSQYYTGYDMWRGDSIQVSFDTKNDDAMSYLADDHEIGFSYTSGGDSVYGYHRGEDEIGDMSGDLLKIVRDGDKKITRYLIRLPKEEIKGIELKVGYEMGWNICINDADVMERDAYIQFTTGTGNRKQPADYKTFRFVKGDKNTASPADDMLYTKINQTQYFDY